MSETRSWSGSSQANWKRSSWCVNKLDGPLSERTPVLQSVQLTMGTNGKFGLSAARSSLWTSLQVGPPVEALFAESPPDKFTPQGMKYGLANDLMVVDIMAMGLRSYKAKRTS
ncbi:hypothetical protein TWF718_000173 [Orbilia javanica]|uniref:Uncharacterized protein n=1 Tax=Orbilia javanica TaxID=47235 RepID=A0AAN8MYX9_9PEZI